MKDARISLEFPIPGHGTYSTRPGSLDNVMARWLPGLVVNQDLVDELKAVINERSGGIDYSDLTTVTECLLVLAEYDGHGL